MMQTCKRGLCLLLALILLGQAVPVTRAEALAVALPEVLPQAEILQNDLFYLASTVAALREGAGERCLLRLCRGGEAETESAVTLKISDMSARCGLDYRLELYDGSAQVQVLCFLYRFAGSPAVPAGTENPFTDVPAGRYYSRAVRWAWAEGVAKGESPTRFAPGKNCTRGQFVTFLYRELA